ncbi:MAG: translation elongation factor Ts [Candidatus Dormibacteraceae bacterium]
MIEVTTSTIRELREMTGAGMMDCKAALESAEGDLARAAQLLREKGIAKAAKRADRQTGAGLVEAYLHRTGDFPAQVGALVEINCETDFVAKGDDFRQLARELAMQVAASNPRWLDVESIPQEVIDQERELYRRKAEQEGKPEATIERIVEGQLRALGKDSCLLEQPWVRDAKVPIKELIAQAVGKLQENITVRRFSRFSIKEG